ncbi:MAG: DUF5009 domain-containing protein [Aureliella sp.]
MTEDPPASAAAPSKRLASIDAYRGIVMFLMLAEVMELASLALAYPESKIASWIAFHTEHVAWTGCSLHDMIQPSFSFLVGVALPFSLASRLRRGDSRLSMATHAFTRSVILIFLGIALRSLGHSTTYFFFEDTLTQIGLGYFVLYLVSGFSLGVQLAISGLVLLSYWQLFALWPLPDVAFSWSAVGVPPDWPHRLDGFAAHWNKNMNPAWYFDTWFMNLFPREEPYQYSKGGYCTLNFIPTFVTMLLGVIAGKVLRESSTTSESEAATHEYSVALGTLLSAGVALAFSGWLLDYFGLCPIVKRIWTPAWTLYSGGLCFLALAALHWVCDVRGWKAWATPVLIIGANSIVAYVMSWTLESPIKAFWLRHLGESPFQIAGREWEGILLGGTVLLTMWLVLWWLKRNRVFVRI